MNKPIVSALFLLGLMSSSMLSSAAIAAPPKKGERVIDVATAEVKAESMARNLRLIGNARSKYSVVVASEVGGKIAAILVNAGQEVKKGAPLLRLDTAKAKATLAEADAYAKNEVRKLTEFRKLHQRGALTKTELDAQQANADIAKARLDAAKENVNDHTLYAPFNATVGLVDVNLGQLVTAGQALLNLNDLSTMQVDVRVPEHYLSDMQENVSVTATSKAWQDNPFSGKIAAIDSQVDKNSLNFRARIDLENNGARLMPGMLMEANFAFEPTVVPVVPIQAVEYSGTKRYVYVVQPDSRVKRTEVKLGGRVDSLVQIDEGINIGDRIVVEGLVSISDGLKINDLSSNAPASTTPALKSEG